MRRERFCSDLEPFFTCTGLCSLNLEPKVHSKIMNFVHSLEYYIDGWMFFFLVFVVHLRTYNFFLILNFDKIQAFIANHMQIKPGYTIDLVS